MRQRVSNRYTRLISLLLPALLINNPPDCSAELLLRANFSEYADGPLVGQQAWTQIGTDAGRPLTIRDGVLRIGALPTSSEDIPYQSALAPFSTTITAGTTPQDVFYSVFLIVNEVPAGGNVNTRGFSLVTSPGDFANSRVSIRQGSAPNTFQFGARQTGQSNVITRFGADLPLGQPILLVGRQRLRPGSGNDYFELYVNPALTQDGQVDPATRYAAGNGGTDPGGFRALSINQYTSDVSSQPGMDILQVAVGTTATSVVPESTQLLCLLPLLATLRRPRR